MPSIYDNIDVRWGWNGDFLDGGDGDLASSATDQIQALSDHIMTIVQADLGDWEEHPTMAAGLSDFVGEPNSRETAKKIKDRVITALTATNTVFRKDLEVRVFPIDAHTSTIIIKVLAARTPQNSIEENSGIVVALLFDYVERNVLPIDRAGREALFN